MKTPVVERAPVLPLMGLWVIPSGQRPRLFAFASVGFPKYKNRLVVGKGRLCDLSVEGDSITSSRHFELSGTGAEVWIRDLESTNGTFLNGVQLYRRRRLEARMLISFGNSSARAVTSDLDLQISAHTVDSFIARSATVHGSSRAAGKAIGRAHTTVQRAKRRHDKKQGQR